MYPQNPQPQQPQQPQGAYPPAGFGYPGYPGAPWPPPQPKQSPWGKVAAAALLGIAAIGGGALFAHYRHQGDHGASSDRAACAVDGARTTKTESKGNGEPTVTVPLRSGWEKYGADEIPGGSKAASDPAIRGIFINTGIRENGFAPNVVITLEKYTDQKISAEEINDREDIKLSKIAQLGDRSSATVCGNTVFIADFTGLNRSGGDAGQTGSTVLSVARGNDGIQWAAVATILTSNPDNAEYRAERDALLQGFHVAFPAK